MSDSLRDLVRIDPTGTAHPVGRLASQWMRGRQGTFRLMPGPPHLMFMRYVGEDGRRDAADGAVCRLAGEITGPGTLCDVVALVGQAGWKGELIVVDASCARSVYFDKGQVVSAHSNAEGERLGEVLYRYGMLTEEQVAQAAGEVTSDLRFGEAAVKLGFLSREKLFQAMARQTEEVVYAVLLVADGMFYVLDDYDESRLVSHLNLQVTSLLMEGVRRMDETRYFRERIPSDLHIPTRVPGRPAPTAPNLAAVFEAIDGQRSLAELCRVVGQGEFEVTQAVFQLLQSGAVVVQPPRPTGKQAIVALFNQIISLILQPIVALDRAPEIREQLASFATGAGVYDVLFQGAGPNEEGTFVAERISDNVAMLVGEDEADPMLSQWLYEYASFALFVAEPVTRGHRDASTTMKKAADLIAQLAPK